jgi:hypothetical protein
MALECIEERRRLSRVRGSAGRAAGVVDQDVHRRARDQCFDLRAQRIGIRHVGCDQTVTLRAAARQRLDNGLQRIGAAREHGDVGAEQREFMRRGTADAFGGAADQRMPAGEIHIHACAPELR